MAGLRLSGGLATGTFATIVVVVLRKCVDREESRLVDTTRRLRASVKAAGLRDTLVLRECGGDTKSLWVSETTMYKGW